MKLESFQYKFLKRSMDIFVSIAGLLLLWPLLLLISLLIKIDSQGPAIYKQTRLGLNNRVFWIYKFRTMPQDIERKYGPTWAKENDSRCTRVGWFLRCFHLDELPQFINILKGDMSLVGPRPERPYFARKFRKSIPGYDRRTQILPGVTGWAQVNGYKGDTSIEKRVELDCSYIENWSFFLDVKIVARTVFNDHNLKFIIALFSRMVPAS